MSEPTAKPTPPPPPTPMQDFLEKHVSDGFKRELDMEEAIWRTLPAFVTAIGLLGGVLSFSLSHLVSIGPQPASIIGLSLVGAGVVSVAWATWHLRFSVRVQRHRYPPDEIDVCSMAAHLKDKHQRATTSASDAEALALEELRALVLTEVAAAASHNHKANAKKFKGRTVAARWIFIALLFTLPAAAATMISAQNNKDGRTDERQAELPAPTTTLSAPAATAVGPKVG